MVRLGGTLKAEADGAGRVILTRVGELLDRYSLATGGDLRGLRGEWRQFSIPTRSSVSLTATTALRSG